jgi:prefoldin subunit 5
MNKKRRLQREIEMLEDGIDFTQQSIKHLPNTKVDLKTLNDSLSDLKEDLRSAQEELGALPV